MDISRREALRRLSVLLGGAVSAPVVDAILSGVRAEPPPPAWTAQALSPRQGELLATLVDLVIPATDTPGARDVGVHLFIDKLLAEWVEPEERARFLRGLDELDQEMRDVRGSAFLEADPGEQRVLVERLDRAAVRARRDDVDPLPFFATLKEWTLVGYYTSEVGATQELRWIPAPGRYDPDLPLDEVGRTWA